MTSVTTSLEKDWDALVQLAPEWDSLAYDTERASVYSTAVLTLGLAKRLDKQFSPACIVAHDESGQLVGIMPLGIRVNPKAFCKRILTPLVEWHASCFDVVANGPAVVDALLKEMGNHANMWDSMDLRFIPSRSPLASATTLDWAEHSVVKEICFDPINGHRSPRDLAKKFRRLERLGGLALDTSTEFTRLPDIVSTFCKLHTARWRDVPGAAEFETDEQIDALYHLLEQTTKSGIARVGSLFIGDICLSIHLSFRWKNTLYCWRTATSGKLEEHSPGSVLYDRVLAAAAAEGCNVAHLGRGAEEFKERWHPQTTPLIRGTGLGSTWRGRLLRMARGLKKMSA